MVDRHGQGFEIHRRTSLRVEPTKRAGDARHRSGPGAGRAPMLPPGVLGVARRQGIGGGRHRRRRPCCRASEFPGEERRCSGRSAGTSPGGGGYRPARPDVRARLGHSRGVKGGGDASLEHQLGRGPGPFACPSGRWIETLTDHGPEQCTHADYSPKRSTPFELCPRFGPAVDAQAANNRYTTSLSGPWPTGRPRPSRPNFPQRNNRKREIVMARFSLSDRSRTGRNLPVRSCFETGDRPATPRTAAAALVGAPAIGETRPPPDDR